MSPYRLRNYGNYLLKKINDNDLKEKFMGHKGKISAVYQFHGINEEQEDDYRRQYQVVDDWINENSTYLAHQHRTLFRLFSLKNLPNIRKEGQIRLYIQRS